MTTIARNELVHRVLAMTDTGWCTRTGVHPAWRVQINHQDAPDRARWALTTLTLTGLVMWWEWPNDTTSLQLATPTPLGLDHLARWDIELLGAPTTSARPLRNLTDAEFDAESRRLFAAFDHRDGAA